MKKYSVFAAAALALLLASAALAIFLGDSSEDRGPQIVDLSIPPRTDTDDGMRGIQLDPRLTQAQPSPVTTVAIASPAASSSGNDTATTKSSAGWVWPTRGNVIVTYAAGDPTRQGIDIAGDFGQPVMAVQDGEVVYSGAGLLGFGELVIVKHSPELLSAYGRNRVRLVKEGDKVQLGQKIAEMGMNDASRVLLHFEVRMNGKPVDPLSLLPARAHASLDTP